MPTWATNEEETAANLNAVLPDGYTATVIGGRNSNSKGDIAITRDATETTPAQYVTSAEAKMLPSAAGVQLVVTCTDGILAPRLPEKAPNYADKFIKLANNYVDRQNQTILLTGNENILAAEILAAKFALDSTTLFIGRTPAGEFLYSTTDAETLNKIFNLRLTIRNKKSGSSRIPANLRETATATVATLGLTTMLENGKLFVAEQLNPNQVTVLNHKLAQQNLWLNTEREIRKLSKTNNLNILLSIELKQGYEQYVKNERQAQELLGNLL